MDWEYFDPDEELPALPAGDGQAAGLGVVGLLVLVFFLYNIFQDTIGAAGADILPVAQTTAALRAVATFSPVAATVSGSEAQAASDAPFTGFSQAEQEAFAAPYKKYTLTQGVHGQSYGHMAIDLAAGKGKPILSPINGKVSDRYTDEYGNPTLVIENDVYRVTLLHGKYTVKVGEVVRLGDKVGEEGNKGYVTDLNGVPCSVNDCGYHSHLNVFDKRKGKNVNPLNLIK